MLKNLLIISLFIFLICTSTKNVFAATMNLQVSTNADDAASFGTEFYVSGEDTNGSAYAGAYPGTDSYWGFARFTLSGTLDAGTTVSNATLELYGFENWQWNTSTHYMHIHVTDSADASQPTAYTNMPTPEGNTTVYPTVGNGIRWPAANGLNWNTSGWNTTVDISSLIQHLIDNNNGLANGAHITVWFYSPNANTAEVGWRDYSRNQDECANHVCAAKLSITYAVGATPTPTPTATPTPTPDPTINDPFSIALWVNPTTSIASKALAVKNQEVRFVTDASGNPVCQIYVGGQWLGGATSSTSLSLSAWQHVACVYDLENIKVFINGELKGQGTAAGPPNDTANSLRIGSDEGGTYGLFSGTVDDVRVYSRFLSGAEVRALYNYAPPPLLYYQYENISGTTVSDASGNNNYGTMTADDSVVTGKFGKGIKAVDSEGIGYTNNMDYKAYTFTSWAKFEDVTEQWNGIRIQQDALDYAYGILIKNMFGGGFMVTHGRVPTEEDQYPTSAASDNQWHHFGFTYDGTSTSKFYLDGVYQGSLTLNPPIYSTSGLKTIYSSNGITYHDEDKFYNYERTPAQIIEDMNGGHPVGGSPVGSQVGYWKLDETNGTTLYDYSPNANHLTASTSTNKTLSGKYNSAVDFESSSSQYASIADNASISLTGSLTLSAWIKPESVTASTPFAIAGKWQTGNESYLLSLYGDEVRMYVDSASNYATTNSANLSAGTWYHIIGVYNSTLQTVNIYINGKLTPSSVTGTIPSSIGDNTSTFDIGYNNSGTIVTSDISNDNSDGADYNRTAANWTIDQGGGQQWIGYWADGGFNQVEAGLRFANITVPQGTTLANASLILTSCGEDVGAGETANMVIYGDNRDDNPGTWTGGSDTPATRYASNRTTANTTFSVTDTSWPTSGQTQSFDVTGIIQEIVNKAGWASGESLRMMIYSTDSSGTQDFCFYDYAYGPGTSEARLSLSYGTAYFDGLIDEVKLYSAAFTPEQAAIEYNNGKTSTFGSLSTASDGINTSNSTDRSFCIPGDTANCNPPITYWDFNENSGTSANEKTGTGYVGSLSGHSWVPGKYGSAIEFKSGNQLSFGSAPLASPDSKITYTAWFKRKSSITSKRVYLFNNKTTWNAQNGWWIDMEDDSDPNVNRALQFGSSGGQFGFYFVDPDTVYPLNEWVHLAASFDEDTDDVKLYVNGVSVAVTQGMAWPEDIYTSTDTATMGGGYNGTSEYELDDVKIYNYVRTPAQIAWDYNRGAPIAWYKFDECTGTTINDWGPNGNGGYNGNTGTLTIGSSGSNTTYGSCGVSGAWNDGITGKFGASMDFDGTDDYVDLGDMTTLEGATQASWSFWVKPTTLDTMKVLLGKFNADNTEISWIIETDPWDSSKLLFGYGINDYVQTQSSVFTNSIWIHVAVVYDANQLTDPEKVKIYVNGINQQLDFSNPVANSLDATNSNVRIASSSDDDRFFSGQIDDVRIYNYALTPTQIKTIMNSGTVNFQ